MSAVHPSSAIITSGGGVHLVHVVPYVKRDGSIGEIEHGLAHDFVKHGFCEFDAKGRCRVVEPNTLKEGEVVDCGTDDDAENLRNLQRVIATSLDGHTIHYFGTHFEQWHSVDDSRDIRTGRKFRRVGGAS